MAPFPDTRVSVLHALATGDPDQRRDAAELLVAAYRGPVLESLRRRRRLELADAEDLTQEFFARALEKQWFARFDPARGRFRSFLRVCADRFAANMQQAANRQKRGGGGEEFSLDDALLAGDDGDAAADAAFRAEWVRSVFQLALDALRAEALAEDKVTHLALFEAYDVADPPDAERPSYAALGARHGLSDSQVINHLAWARRRFRVHVLGVLRRLARSEAEYREDVRELLDIEPPE